MNGDRKDYVETLLNPAGTIAPCSSVEWARLHSLDNTQFCGEPEPEFDDDDGGRLRWKCTRIPGHAGPHVGHRNMDHANSYVVWDETGVLACGGDAAILRRL